MRKEDQRACHVGVGVRTADLSIYATERPLSPEYLRAVMTVDVLCIQLFTNYQKKSPPNQPQLKRKKQRNKIQLTPPIGRE